MQIIKENDFVEMEYTGKIKNENIVFDTTSKEEAESAGIFNQNIKYKPIVICVGHGHVLKGIDKELNGKIVGEEYVIEISPEDGFGKKRAELLQLVATPKFRKYGINPVPGLQVNIDNMVGIIKTVTGGRTLVDFNHPCAGKDLVYKIKINKLVTDTKEKIQAILFLVIGEQLIENIELIEKTAIVTIKISLPKELKEKVTENVKKYIPEITELQYQEKKEEEGKKKENI